MQEVINDHALARLASLPWTAPAHAPHVYLPHEVEILVKGVTVPVHGLGGRVTGLASRTLAPQTLRGRVDEGALAVTRHVPLLPVCGLDDPGRGLVTATETVECARALGATDDCAHDRLAITRPGVTTRGHTGPTTGHVAVAGLVTALPFLLTNCGQGRGVGGPDGVAGIARRLLLLPTITATLGQRWSLPLQLWVAPSLFPRPLSQTSSGCSSACIVPWRSGMRL